MPLITTAVPNLIQGVSQQSDASRFAGQCAEQENAISSVAEGLKKRPNTRHINKIESSAIDSDSFIHFIKRTDNEQYVLILENNSLKAYNLNTGAEENISGDRSYLNNTSSPRSAIKALTIADSTFIVNTEKTVTKRSSTSSALAKEALVFVKQGDYEKKYGYKIKVGSGSAQPNVMTTLAADDPTGGQAAASSTILSGLVGAAANSEGIVDHSDSNLLIISHTSDFSIEPVDDLSGSGMGVVHKEVASISDLPLFAKNGFEVKIKGDAELAQDDYYVRFETTSGESVGKGVWVECLAPNTDLGYTTSTLPLELVSTASGFTARPMQFADRTSGNDDSNPLASFTDKKLSNLFFFKNRLGFLCEDNIIMSESGFGGLDETLTPKQTIFNFGRTTVTTLLDSDPIDISVASSRVTDLKAAKGFQENLILFADNGQFVLKGGSLLTPKTVSVTPITNFNYELQVEPLPLGAYIYFPFTRGNYTGFREFTVNSTTDTYDSSEVTEHVPAYIPKNIVDMAGTTSEDVIVLLSDEERNALYIYNYFWSNNQKVLSSWNKYTFAGEIRGFEFVDSTLKMVTVYNGATHLVEMPLESGLTDTVGGVDSGFVTHLDMRLQTTANGSSLSINTNYTPENNSIEVYTTDGLKLLCTNTGSTINFTTPLTSATDVFVGIPYNMKYTFSQQLFKAKAGNSTSPSNAASLLIRNGSIYFDKSGFFNVTVTPKHRTPYTNSYTNEFTPEIVGSSVIGNLNLDSGFYRFPVFTRAKDTIISIENNTALPSNFQSAEFESFLHARSSRYA